METGALAVGATGLCILLFYFTFFVQSMFFIPFAILHKFKLTLHVPPVLLGCVISSVTLGTFKCDLFNSTFLFTCHINKLPFLIRSDTLTLIDLSIPITA